MRMVSKITSEKYHLTKGKIYVFEKTPKMYDPITFEEVIGYLIRNDLGQFIKIWHEYNPRHSGLYLDHFTTLSELRDKKLNDLGI